MEVIIGFCHSTIDVHACFTCVHMRAHACTCVHMRAYVGTCGSVRMHTDNIITKPYHLIIFCAHHRTRKLILRRIT